MGPYDESFKITTDAAWEKNLKAFAGLSAAEREYMLGVQVTALAHKIAEQNDLTHRALNLLGQALKVGSEAEAQPEPEPEAQPEPEALTLTRPALVGADPVHSPEAEV